MIEEYINLICSKLEQEKDDITIAYNKKNTNQNTKFVAIDNLLPEDLALEIYNAFPKTPENWRLMDTFRENKFTSKQFDRMPSILKDITFALQDQRIINIVEKITGLQNQVADPTLYAGGLSMMTKQHFLQPHIDNSHDGQRTLYRRLNLLYYITPNWSIENGGHLELWDDRVKDNDLIESKFNRLVLMETNSKSWHSVDTVNTDTPRCCVSNYYFSKESPTGQDYFHITSFMARPEQKIQRFWCGIDNFVRSNLRMFVKNGFGKKDVYIKK